MFHKTEPYIFVKLPPGNAAAELELKPEASALLGKLQRLYKEEEVITLMSIIYQICNFDHAI